METSKGARCRRARLTLRTIIRGWPWWYDETTPVFPREILLRAVPNVLGYFHESMGNWSVDPYAFQPRKFDTDGISFFRLDFSTPEQVANACQHPSHARVARITVQQLRGLGLAVECAPDTQELAGHVIVPDMKFVARPPKDAKRRIADLTQKLAQFASRNKVYAPRGLPDPVPPANN